MAGRHGTSSRRGGGSSAETLARSLGWFSIGLGLAEIFAARRIARSLGMKKQSGLVRAYGVREVATGLGILASRDPTPWIWARVGGDGLDLATLAAGLKENRHRDRVGLALGAVAGVTVLDLVCAQALHQEDQQPPPALKDYSDRSGFPRPPDAMRGAARRDRAGAGQSTGAQTSAGRNRGFGVQITLQDTKDGAPTTQPLVVVARDERDAELVAASLKEGHADVQTLRELTDDEAKTYGLDLNQHGDAKALPVLNL